ncbi:MAG: ABC transporter permease, partial [Thermoanaerobaculia bacterium]
MTRSSPTPDTPGAMSAFGRSTSWRQLLHRTRLETAEVLWSAPFLVLLLLGLTFVVAFALIAGENRGASVYPLTYMMLQGLGVGLQMFLVITIVFLSGELVHRERGLQLSQVCDALPVPTWAFLVSKLLTLGVVVAVFITAGIVSTVGIQLSRGYFHLEPGLYARGFLAIAVPCLLLAVLSLCVQVLANNKFLGYLLMVAFLGVRYGMPLLGYEHYLLRYGGSPRLSYSDMNGYGHFAEPFLWFNLYWSFAAILLLALSTLFWVRGTDTSFGSRISAARRRWSGSVRTVVAVAALGLVASGGYIFYNTNILNDYTPRSRRIERLADYERKYRQHGDDPLPRITAVQADVDIFPGKRRLMVRGTYRIENQGVEPIRVLPVTLSPRMDLNVLPLSGGIT